MVGRKERELPLDRTTPRCGFICRSWRDATLPQNDSVQPEDHLTSSVLSAERVRTLLHPSLAGPWPAPHRLFLNVAVPDFEDSTYCLEAAKF